MIGGAGLLLAAALSAQGAAAPADSRREPLLKLEEEMLAAAEVLPPRIRALEEVRARCRFAGWLEGARRRKERAALEDDFEASLLRLQAAQKSYDLERRELRGRKKFEMVRGAMVGEVSEDSYAAASSRHKKVSVKIDAVLAWAAAARAAESEACSRPERRRAALRFAAKWTGICLAAAVLLAGAYYFAFLAAP